MKATQILKSVAAMTALTVFLAGCSGSQEVTPKVASSSTSPVITQPLSQAAVVSSTTQSVGTTSTDASDQLTAALNNFNATNAANQKQMKKIADDASSANKKAGIGMWIGV